MGVRQVSDNNNIFMNFNQPELIHFKDLKICFLLNMSTTLERIKNYTQSIKLLN